MTAIVFAGPSIYGFDEAILAAVEIRPPAACGDILRACRDNAARIGLIDGIFESGPSAWHKEILFALSAGIEVFGAASMGALRAAECHHFGMQGVGRVFEQYRSGRTIGRLRRRSAARAAGAWLPAAHRGAGGRRRDDSVPVGIGAAGAGGDDLLVRRGHENAFQGAHVAAHFGGSRKLSGQGGMPSSTRFDATGSARRQSTREISCCA